MVLLKGIKIFNHWLKAEYFKSLTLLCVRTRHKACEHPIPSSTPVPVISYQIPPHTLAALICTLHAATSLQPRWRRNYYTTSSLPPYRAIDTIHIQPQTPCPPSTVPSTFHQPLYGRLTAVFIFQAGRFSILPTNP